MPLPPRRALLALLAWVWLASVVFASGGRGARIVGELVDGTGAPLGGAAVLVRSSDDRVVRTHVTTADGRFEVEGLAPGRYTLEVTPTGFERLERVVSLAPDVALSLHLVATLTEFAQQVVVRAARTGDTRTTDTPLAVTTLGAGRLSALGARSALDLTGSAPSLMVADTAGFSQPTLRGISTSAFFAGSDPSVATYIDGVYIARSSAALADLVDVDRVEIVRGPQGALYGRNALAGLVHVYTREPSNETEASASIAVGPHGLMHAEARAAGALVRDRLMASVAVSRDARQGFVRDLTHPDRSLGSRDSFSGVAKLRAVFGPTTDLLVSIDGSARNPVPLSHNKVLSVKPGFTLDVPRGFWDVRTTAGVETYTRQRLGGVSARLRWMPRAVQLQSLAAVRWIGTEVRIDSDFTELPLTATSSHQHAWQFSEELTARARAGRLAWLAGVVWFSERDRQPLEVLQQPFGREFRIAPDSRVEAPAAFASATLALGRGLDVTAGFRYGVDRKRMVNHVGSFRNDAVLGRLASVDVRKSMTYGVPQLGVNWRSGALGLAYVAVSSGSKSGGYNASVPDPGRGYAPERTASVELGVKRPFGRDRGWLHALAYSTRYTDLQVQTIVRPGVADVRNAADAGVRGAELEGSYSAGRNTFVDGGLAYLDARYHDYLALAADGLTFDARNKRLNRAPRLSGRASVAWSTDALRPGTVRVRAELQAMSRVFFTPANDTVETQAAFALVHARAAFEPRGGHWSIGLFGRNLTDEPFIVGTVGSSPAAISAHPGERRSIGVEFTVHR